MSDHAVTGYFVAGILCAIGCRILLRRLGIKPSRYWSVILGEGTEAIIFTVLLWPVTLAAIVLWYVLKRWADRCDAKLKARNSERIERERANPMSALSLDDLLKKVEEQKREASSQ
ncbi:hypothetical protein ASA1KI_03550 [Opitutales bacterium ASA1]|uniref:hypothetical protein n=1 Tax=Congregicoccus parvus TaxID=3081749 RepID=UPI002B291316|nr:hypothetical protein ASA1KI_03550 [Opitutales bacterium ASA1]